MQSHRDHDRFYLRENRKREPKEAFKFIHEQSKGHLAALTAPKILDIGCATGDFLFYLSTMYPQADLTGLDVMPELIERAKQEVPNARFMLGDVMSRATLPEGTFDAIYLNGVHSIFDEYEPWLDNILEKLQPDGRAYVFGIFNHDDVDVLVKVRPSGEDGAWQPGWNVISKKSIALYLEKRGASHHFVDWSLPIDIAKNASDPLRSWTFLLQDGSRGVVNGTCVLHTFSLLEMSRMKTQSGS
jgi:SAM-dependent methyltransferase